jgi:hypothetical protein
MSTPARSVDTERRIPLWKLLPFRHILKHFNSFTEPVFKCNFTTETGWRGKTYVKEHQVTEYTPVIRADELLNLYHISTTDMVTLNETQYGDFKIVTRS